MQLHALVKDQGCAAQDLRLRGNRLGQRVSKQLRILARVSLTPLHRASKRRQTQPGCLVLIICLAGALCTPNRYSCC